MPSVSVGEVVSVGERACSSVVKSSTVDSTSSVGGDTVSDVGVCEGGSGVAVTDGDVVGVGVGGCTAIVTRSVASTSVVTSVGIVLWVHSLTSSIHHCVESVVVVGGVLHGSDGAIGFVQAVCTLDHVSVPGFPLALGVSGFVIAHAVIEVVLGMGLKISINVLVLIVHSIHSPRCDSDISYVMVQVSSMMSTGEAGSCEGNGQQDLKHIEITSLRISFVRRLSI